MLWMSSTDKGICFRNLYAVTILDEIKRHSKVAVNENEILFIFPSFSQVREATNRVVLNASDLEIRSVTCSGQGMRV